MNEYNRHPDSTLAHTLLMLVCGAAIGASVALLYAPKSGQDLRDQISDGANRAMDTADGWKDNAMTSVKDTIGRAADNLHDAVVPAKKS